MEVTKYLFHLVTGAAITDKRLNSGDQILEVNGVSMEGKSQDEAVAILRNMKRGSNVSLLVSRKDMTTVNENMPRQLVHVTSSQSSTYYYVLSLRSDTKGFVFLITVLITDC